MLIQSTGKSISTLVVLVFKKPHFVCEENEKASYSNWYCTGNLMKIGQMSKSFPDNQSQPFQTRATLPAGSEGHLEDLESIPRSKSSLFTTFKLPSLPVATFFGYDPSFSDFGVSFNHITVEMSGFM